MLHNSILVNQSSGGSAITITDTLDAKGGTIREITAVELRNQTRSVTPTETAQTVEPASGYTGLSQVSVGAIDSNYVGSGVDRNDSTDLTASGATVTAPAGYYETAATKTISSGTMGTPTATKGTVSNHTVTVTPSVTNTAGYIAGGTVNGSGVSVSASELVSGNLAITENGTGIDVTNYETVSVDVPSSGGASSWELVTQTTLTVNTTSTSAASAGTVACGSGAFTADDVIWVHIRGQSGKRNGYFYGSDAIFINHQKANGGTSTFSTPAVEYIRVSDSGTYTTSTGSYGVYAYSISSSGTLTIRRRYNSTNTLTINDTFDVYVYKLSLPSPLTLFD